MSRTPSRTGWLLVLGVVAALVVAVWTTAGSEEYPTTLDPRNPGPEGAQALAEVLDGQGVDVTIVRSADDLEEAEVDGGTTVLVTSTDDLSPGTLDRLRRHARPGRLVLVEPSYRVVQEVDSDLGALTVYPDELDARCEGGEGPAGIDVDGLRVAADRMTVYRADDRTLDGARCFGRDDGAVLVESRTADIVLFGAGEALSNDQVLRGDNAAVGLRLAGAGRRLVWYVPDPADATSDEAVALSSLIPRWIEPGLWLALLAGLGLLLWRVRRLGPLSTEPLPVVVRAVETARSRGRMYRRSGDHGHAATALRRAARTDLAARLGLDRRAEVAEVVEVVAAHTDRPVERVAALLDDTIPPTSDQDLVRLAQELARLRREVRRG
ncbi:MULTISPECIES: DUF4350 domain-containing protein [unclassified Nocardioides]|jgi:hypothetical protein|uniref:DUF4350 domain-containing protein n=1 Tax=unclassified Nocardioides TaxID=2615069 RepID=UPI000702B9B3|nr:MULTISPECIES: DUF4350 domain-containing protein [unclassified Nocardioides]KRC55098.1 hypothetical protein ASE19_06605 [Nocardioides sp. Root79]KRC72094.1 hypothetical protein ASE20_05470 [Nocardioides sp. Root240]